MNEAKTPLLEMRNISKDFFGNQVLADIDLTVGEGEVIGLVGEHAVLIACAFFARAALAVLFVFVQIVSNFLIIFRLFI